MGSTWDSRLKAACRGGKAGRVNNPCKT